MRVRDERHCRCVYRAKLYISVNECPAANECIHFLSLSPARVLETFTLDRMLREWISSDDLLAIGLKYLK